MLHYDFIYSSTERDVWSLLRADCFLSILAHAVKASTSGVDSGCDSLQNKNDKSFVASREISKITAII